MPAKFALKTAPYVAIVGVLGHDERARTGVNVDDFITALVTIGFAWMPNTDSTKMEFRWVRGPEDKREHLLLVQSPAACDVWWGYEHAELARVLEDDFELNYTDFIEVRADIAIKGNGFSIMETM
ncbi:hypothetical protein C8Q73DRAFT_795264 [Cubamyces lactineus]|nr:hypothetical protein C8Q73DRAFT_795264 [Cubamyces lactineus]